jgi:MoaA/NifB/PqqE/SkfB family radical SAM enzyme
MRERLVVVVRVTGNCNLGCGFCAFDRRVSFERHELDADGLLRVGELLASHRDSQAIPVHLSLLGGEPTLWQPLPGIERALATELGLSLGITTNGTTLADPNWRRRLLSYYDELTLSIDGPGSIHDELRMFRGGFEKTRRAVVALLKERERGVRRLLLRVNTVLMQRTLPHFEELCSQLADWGVDEITFNALGGADRPEFYREERLLPEDFRTLRRCLPALRSRLEARGVLLRGGDAYLRRLEQTAAGGTLAVAECRPGERFLFVDHTTRLSPCSFTARDYGVRLSSVSREHGLLELSRRFRVKRNDLRSTHCDDCRSTQVFSKWAMPETKSTSPEVGRHEH